MLAQAHPNPDQRKGEHNFALVVLVTSHYSQTSDLLSLLAGLCNSELGMQSYWIQNADITASSIRDVSHDPGQARLHGNGAWMPLIQDTKQFLQIYFKDETNVSAVAVQGHPNSEYWVTKYSLSYSLDGKAWEEPSEVHCHRKVYCQLLSNC